MEGAFQPKIDVFIENGLIKLIETEGGTTTYGCIICRNNGKRFFTNSYNYYSHNQETLKEVYKQILTHMHKHFNKNILNKITIGGKREKMSRRSKTCRSKTCRSKTCRSKTRRSKTCRSKTRRSKTRRSVSLQRR
jgi:hypothetical protein